MGDIWLFFVRKINSSNQRLIHYFSILFKNILNGSYNYSENSIKNLEIQKLKWDIKHIHRELGEYIYKCNSLNNAFDFSNDLHFNELVKKIKKIENFINEKNKINKIEK